MRFDFDEEMKNRGRRYYRKQMMWEYAEGAVIVLLCVGMIAWWIW
jgi:hypothetical protein